MKDIGEILRKHTLWLDGADGGEKANLSGANLSGANLRGEILKISPITLTGLRWWILVSDDYLEIGCQRHTHAEWADFNDDAIAAMDSSALAFWRVWKEPLLAMCASHKAEAERAKP